MVFQKSMDSLVFYMKQRSQMPNLQDLPQKESLGLVNDVIIEELNNLIKTLDFQIVKLKGIKQELLKLK